ncbi:MAG: sugar ABC transporter permease, partial [Dehalococcoidia bacterium]
MSNLASVAAAEPRASREAGVRKRFGRIAEACTGYAFLAPSLLVFGTFIFYPLIKSIYLGFYVSNPFGTGQTYVGTDQYHRVLTSDEFRNALTTTA